MELFITENREGLINPGEIEGGLKILLSHQWFVIGQLI